MLKFIYHIKNFGTLFPYGGNDRLEAPYLDAMEYFFNGDSVWNLFDHKRSNRGKRGGAKRKTYDPNRAQPDTYDVNTIKDVIIDTKNNGTNFRLIARNLINGSKKDTVIQLAKVTQDIHDINIRYILTDLTRHYMNRDEHLTKSDTKQKNFIMFKYTNRYMDDLSIPKLCNILSYPCSNINRVPSYSYTKPIRNKIINYNSAILQLEDEIPDSCNCTSSPFIDQDIGHIVTGNLGIITDTKLRNLLCKGLTYRECHNPKKSDVIKSMEKDLDNHIIKISDKKSIPVSCFDLWKSGVLTNAKADQSLLKLSFYF